MRPSPGSPRSEGASDQQDIRRKLELRCRDWLMTTRKKNVSLGFSTHSLSQVFSSALGPLLEEGCPHRFFLPMTAALEPNIPRHFPGSSDSRTMRCGRLPPAGPQREVYYFCKESPRAAHVLAAARAAWGPWPVWRRIKRKITSWNGCLACRRKAPRALRRGGLDVHGFHEVGAVCCPARVKAHAEEACPTCWRHRPRKHAIPRPRECILTGRLDFWASEGCVFYRVPDGARWLLAIPLLCGL